MKQCFKCNEIKSLDGFYKHALMADGHLNKCKECTKRDVRNYRYGEARERILRYDRERAKMPHRKAQARRIISRWQRKHPERRTAHSMLRNAILSGRVSPWPVCAIPECSAKPEAHHPDYSNPLDVVWLCPSHHKQAHAIAWRKKSKKEA